MDKDNKDIFYKIIEKSKEIGLTEREKISLFKVVDAYVEKNPIQILEANPATAPSKSRGKIGATDPVKAAGDTDGAVGPLGASVVSPFFGSFMAHWNMYGVRAGMAMLILFFIGSGTSLAAKNSLPGDFLYPIRVNVNEEVKAAFLSGPERSEYEVKRVKSRVEEAKTLAEQNQLTEEIKNKISVQLNTHVVKVKKDLAELNRKGEFKSAFEISRDLEESFDGATIDTAVAKKLNEDEQDGENTEIKELAAIEDVRDIVAESYEASVAARQNAENQILAQDTDDDDAQTIATAKYETVKKSLDLIDKAPSAAVYGLIDSNLNERVKVARGLFEKGEEMLEAEEYNNAFLVLNEAYTITLLIQQEMDIKRSEEIRDANNVEQLEQTKLEENLSSEQ